ncbi:MAG TPA: prepilin-type N-terminal cleavage/methylation domain-containing protein [Bacillota bacterium]|jgi:prepilin-type N-terminal cleavage/methylation domain-containing protein
MLGRLMSLPPRFRYRFRLTPSLKDERGRGLLRDERGFTVAELLVTIAVMGMVLASIVIFQAIGAKLFRMNDTATETQQNLRVATERMTREIRQGKNGTFSLTAGVFSYSSLRFDLPGTPTKTVQYRLDATTTEIIRDETVSSVTTSTPIASGVQTLTFALSTDRSRVTVSVTSQTRNDTTQTMTAESFIRVGPQ